MTRSRAVAARRAIGGALALALAALASCQARSVPGGVVAGPGDLVITNVTVIDVKRGAHVPGVSIIIRGDTIRHVVPSDKVSLDPGAKVVDGKGKFAIPGLWDMHVHTGPAEVFLPLYIANGITGIRDVGGDLPKATGNASLSLDIINEWREAIKAGTLVGPRIVATGPIIDGPIPYWPGVTFPVANPEAARELVRDLKRRGADFIKVYEKLPRDTYYAIADESKKNGLPFIGHVPQALTLSEASNAGQRSIEHSSQILKNHPDTWPALFALLKKNDTWMVPTFSVSRYLVTPGQGFLDDERLKYIPVYIQDIWRKSWWHKDRSPRQLAWYEGRYRALEKAAREMHEAGVGILAGSDSANPYTYPGFSLHDELERLVGAGFSPADALAAATTQPAKFLGTQSTMGSIEPGKLADIVLLDADPLADIRNTRAIHAVIVNGRHFSREELRDMLDAAAKAASRMVDK